MNKVELYEYLVDIQVKQGPDFVYESGTLEEAIDKKDQIGNDTGIKILSGLGGFLSTVLFIGLLIVLEIIESDLQYIVAGLVFVSLSIWANYYFNQLSIDTASISLYIIGIILILIGISEFTGSGDAGVYISIAVVIAISVSNILINKSFFMLLLSCFGISGGIIAIFVQADVLNLLHIIVAVHTAILLFISFHESKFITAGKTANALYLPILITVILSLIFLMVAGSLNEEESVQKYFFISSIIFFGAIIYFIHNVLNRFENISQTEKIYIYAGSLILIAPTLLYPPFAGSLLLILLCFYIGYLPGLSLSIISLIYFTIYYYYNLEYSLLNKSLIMLISGIFFTASYFVISKLIDKSKG